MLDTARDLPAMRRSCSSREAAHGFLVDFYDAFSYDPAAGEVFLLQVDRGEWHVQVVEPVDYYAGFLEAGPFAPGAAALDSVFYFRDTPYRWLPLLRERIRQPPTGPSPGAR